VKILIVGSGGREHALAWRLRQSPQVTGLWVAGGNAGTAHVATNLGVYPEDVDAVVAAATAHNIDLVVVGPELPLARGLVDRLEETGIPAFGPTQAAAQIEASKAFAREVMQQAGVPGPEFRVFHEQRDALDFLERHHQPVVVKADGLAAGKGVALCSTAQEATLAVQACMSDRIFGEAGNAVIIEEWLQGREVSVFAFCDGQRLSRPVAACDYKRVGEGDTGPNTGGMGSYAPPEFWTPGLAEEIADRVMRPTVEALAQRGTPYRGVLYAGLMLTKEGPRVLEFNCRFGDPEAQVILPLLRGEPAATMLACAQGRLEEGMVRWADQPHVGVVMVSGGYPGRYESGQPIAGLEAEQPNSVVFQAGTRLERRGGEPVIVTNGGRVLTVVGWADTLDEARARAYRRVETIQFQGAYYRSDIAAPPDPRQEDAWSPDPAARAS
jgi:phosphoribosylamine---glycine ligase